MYRLTLANAEKMIDAAFAKGRELELKPLSVVVLDPGGHPIAFKRDDGASLMRFEIATGKAAGALALGVSSRTIGDMAGERPTFVAALASAASPAIVPAAGGVIIVDGDGHHLGAIGVTGDTSDNDEVCALAGIAAAGLSALA